MNDDAKKLIDFLDEYLYADKLFALLLESNNGLCLAVDDFRFHEYHRYNGILELRSIGNNNNLSVKLDNVRDFKKHNDGSGFSLHYDNNFLDLEMV